VAAYLEGFAAALSVPSALSETASPRATPQRSADADDIRLTTVGGNYVAAIKSDAGTVDLPAWGTRQY